MRERRKCVVEANQFYQEGFFIGYSKKDGKMFAIVETNNEISHFNIGSIYSIRFTEERDHQMSDKTKVLRIIEALSELNAGDLDALSVAELAQFYYWISKWQGSVFLKSVGRLGVRIEGADGN